MFTTSAAFINFAGQLWKLSSSGKLINKLTDWEFSNTTFTLPKIGTTGAFEIKDIVLTVNNQTYEIEFEARVDGHVNNYWQWKMSSPDANGWSLITNQESNLLLTNKLRGRTPALIVEEKGV